MQVCVQIYVVWDYASRESEVTAVHIGTTLHCNNWIAKLAKAYCIHLSTHVSLQSACGYHCKLPLWYVTCRSIHL